MKLKTLHMAVSLALIAGFAQVVEAASFGAGNLAIYRVGTGTGSLVNTGNAVFLDEYTQTGTLVQSIAMPTVKVGNNNGLLASGTATSEGGLTRSADGSTLVLTGYSLGGATSLSGTTGSANPRTVGLVDATGAIDTSTALTDFASGNNPRSATSTNGTDLWVAGGAGGIRYTTRGATTSTQVSTTLTNSRQVNIFGGQLYQSDSTGTAIRLGTVGTGLPTTAGQTITSLPGIPGNATPVNSPYSFFMADLSTSVAGLDTLYVADDTSALSKYSLVGGNWSLNGTVGTGTDAYRGLTGAVDASTGQVSLFATRKGGSGATGGGELVSLFDLAGYNANFSSSTINLLATAGANTAFRGVAFAPVSAVPVPAALPFLLSGLGMLGALTRRKAG